jgi:quinoprotein glucose dehydrogenase
MYRAQYWHRLIPPIRLAITQIGLAAAVAIMSCSRSAPDPDVEWASYGGDAGGSKYSPIMDINRHNVAGLGIAWMARVGDFPPEVFDSCRDPRAHREPHMPTGARLGGLCRAYRFEVTPLMVGGTLYVSTPLNRVIALDPATGATRWTFDPRIDISLPYAEALTSRGVSAWIDDFAVHDAPCARRIFLATIDARLFALDASDGSPCERFGDSGYVRLDRGIGLANDPVETSQYSVTSPPAVIRDLVVVGSAVRKTSRRQAASGVVRAYDARTGALRWSFDPIPRTHSHPAWSSWSPGTASLTGGANVWSIISTDRLRDLVFLATGSAAPDFYGGNRPGRNDYANALVALRASTGVFVWAFQTVHHDLWDYDVAAQPVLVNFRDADREVPAVIVANKAGMIFVLHRESGVPLLPVEERAVPESNVRGEAAWPTQPFQANVPLLHGRQLTTDSAFAISDVDRAFCRERIASLRNEGIFTPPSLQGTLVWPGYWGGINWDGMAWDPERQLLVTTVKRLATVVRLHARGGDTSEGIPYDLSRGPLVARSGIPCTPPPWGSLVAVSLTGNFVRWARPVGALPQLRHIPDSDAWGSLLFGGPLVTAGGVVFLAASQDNRFRAFDVETGGLLWDYELPAGGQAAPMTYRWLGRQYVAIAAGGRAGIGSAGDWIVAFALPEKGRLGILRLGGRELPKRAASVRRERLQR